MWNTKQRETIQQYFCTHHLRFWRKRAYVLHTVVRMWTSASPLSDLNLFWLRMAYYHIVSLFYSFKMSIMTFLQGLAHLICSPWNFFKVWLTQDGHHLSIGLTVSRQWPHQCFKTEYIYIWLIIRLTQQCIQIWLTQDCHHFSVLRRGINLADSGWLPKRNVWSPGVNPTDLRWFVLRFYLLTIISRSDLNLTTQHKPCFKI